MTFEGITFITPSGKMAVLEVDRLNPYVLTGGSAGRIEKVANFLKDAEIIRASRGHVVVNGTFENLKVSAVSIGMGPGSAAILLPEIIETAKGGFITIMRMGTCGGLQPYVRPGHFHIPTSSIRDEGTTQAVVGAEYPAIASPEMIPVMLLASQKHGYELGENLWIGPVITKDDLFFKQSPQFSPRRMELSSRHKSFREMGAISSEMEFSVYCILRDYYERYLTKRILVGCILAVLDQPAEEGRIDLRNVDLARGMEAPELEDSMIRIGLETFVLMNRLRKGEDIKLDETIRKMIAMPPRSQLLGQR
jgi:uridine phosphorylase